MPIKQDVVMPSMVSRGLVHSKQTSLHCLPALKLCMGKSGMVMYTFNLNTEETKTGGSLEF